MHDQITTGDSSIPLTPTSFYILLSLAAGERHGYSIMQEVSALTHGTIRLWPGTLYRTIRSMLGDGLIVEVTDQPAIPVEDERRRYYRLTERGWGAAQTEARRLASLLEIASQRRLLAAEAAPNRGE